MKEFAQQIERASRHVYVLRSLQVTACITVYRVVVVKKISLDGETKREEMKCRIVESLRSRIPPLSYASYHIRVDRRLAPAKRVEK